MEEGLLKEQTKQRNVLQDRLKERNRNAAQLAAEEPAGKPPDTGGLLEIDLKESPCVQREFLDSIVPPEFGASPDEAGLVPHIPGKFYSHQIVGKDKHRACLAEALTITTATGHSLPELEISIADLEFASKNLGRDPTDSDSGFSVSMPNRAFESTCSTGHSFRLEHFRIAPSGLLSAGVVRSGSGLDSAELTWLSLFVPLPMMVVSLHRVVTSKQPMHHWVAIDLARLVIQIAPSSRCVDDSVVGVAQVELQDLTNEANEASFAKRMTEKYHLGPPIRAYKMMVHVNRLHDACFARPDLYSNHWRVVQKSLFDQMSEEEVKEWHQQKKKVKRSKWHQQKKKVKRSRNRKIRKLESFPRQQQQPTRKRARRIRKRALGNNPIHRAWGLTGHRVACRRRLSKLDLITI